MIVEIYNVNADFQILFVFFRHYQFASDDILQIWFLHWVWATTLSSNENRLHSG